MALHTTREIRQQLGISHHTLQKILKRYNIKPTQMAGRFMFWDDESVERIAKAVAEEQRQPPDGFVYITDAAEHLRTSRTLILFYAGQANVLQCDKDGRKIIPLSFVDLIKQYREQRPSGIRQFPIYLRYVANKGNTESQA